MQPFWDPLEETRTRQLEHLARVERARLRRLARRAEAPRGGAPLAVRTAQVLRQLADHLEAGAARPA